MQIRNACVLLNEVNCEIAAGKLLCTAVLDSAVSRIRRVSMADFATVLTHYIVPVLYVIFFRIKIVEGMERSYGENNETGVNEQRGQ